MTIVDKAGSLVSTRPPRLDRGCGPTKRGPGYVGVDLVDGPEVDVVGDAVEVLRSLGDESVDEIYSSHFLEHVDDLLAVVDEFERVLVVSGRLHVVVPHFSNPYYYSDPTHRRPFGLYTFSYFAEDPILRRRVPRYGHRPRLRLESARLGFRTEAEAPGSGRFRRSVGRLVNRSIWLQELYEESLAGMIPCYELYFELVKIR